MLGTQVGPLGVPGRGGRLGQQGPQPLGALAGAAAAVLARRLVVAGAHTRPRGKVARGREAAHVGADLGDDALGGAPVDAGDGAQQPHLTPERGEHPVDLGRQLGDRLVQEVDLGQDGSDQQGVVGPEAPDQGLLELGDLGGRIRPRASWARIWGSRSPSTRASSMARADFPWMSVATLDSLTPASCSTLSRRWASRPRFSIWALRYLVRFRSSRMGLGGTNDGRTRPCSTSWQIHSASPTSVLRPGTLRRCRALSSQHSAASSKT